MLSRLWIFNLDPRHYQILILGSLLAYGILALDFEVELLTALLLVSSALGAQYLATRRLKLPALEPRSALISSLSLTLLLRVANPWLAVPAAFLAIFSKFFLRHQAKHIFNPANFGLVSMMLITDRAWVSPGQWGNQVFFALLVAGLGSVVTIRALRADIVLAFLAAYSGILFGRAWWLGDPWAIPLHQLQNGALLVFAFFMISDPKSTPDSRAGRLIFAGLVAAVGAYIQFGLYRGDGLIWALACCAPLVPLLDRFLPGRRYRWPG